MFIILVLTACGERTPEDISGEEDYFNQMTVEPVKLSTGNRFIVHKEPVQIGDTLFFRVMLTLEPSHEFYNAIVTRPEGIKVGNEVSLTRVIHNPGFLAIDEMFYMIDSN